MSFIHEDFMLTTETGRRLYHEIALGLPIIDYHCHLNPKDIAENRRFHNLYEIWLEGDHYKWRAMRANGVDEQFCTGNADPYDKFLAWAGTVPQTLRNPLYHWTHLELKRYFGIDTLLSPETASRIWDEANERLQDDDRTTHGILRSFRVESLCTTDDPADHLKQHAAIQNSSLETRVFPAFRPDAVLEVSNPEKFNRYVERLGHAAGTDVTSLHGLLQALEVRHNYFHQMGCRLSDHGLSCALGDFCSEAEAARIYERVRGGETVSREDEKKFGTLVMLTLARMDSTRGWVKQMHLGAQRSNNTRQLRALGPDTGFDSIGDWSQAQALARFLDALDLEHQLPKTILYNLNPSDNYVFASMIGNYQDGTIPGKMQYGSGWWFCDQLEGMTLQLNALSNLGLLSRFVGMLTDSRSFMSYPRHEYFRRLLCDILGREAEQGLIPNSFGMLSELVRNVCYANAREYFAFPMED